MSDEGPVDHGIGAVLIRRITALGSVAAAITLAAASGAFAQTLTDTPAHRKSSPPPGWKSKPSAVAKKCEGFGAGFINVPGTDACVRIGGWVTIEGSGSR